MELSLFLNELKNVFNQNISAADILYNNDLKYPCTLVLFCIMDAIGSYHKNDKKYTISIDGKNKFISATNKHFYIINDKNYYHQSLSEDDIEVLYKGYRCLLAHNSIMSEAVVINHSSTDDLILGKSNLIDLKTNKYALNLNNFLSFSKQSVESFLKKADSIVPNSHIFKNEISKNDVGFISKIKQSNQAICNVICEAKMVDVGMEGIGIPKK